MSKIRVGDFVRVSDYNGYYDGAHGVVTTVDEYRNLYRARVDLSTCPSVMRRHLSTLHLQVHQTTENDQFETLENLEVVRFVNSNLTKLDYNIDRSAYLAMKAWKARTSEGLARYQRELRRANALRRLRNRIASWDNDYSLRDTKRKYSWGEAVGKGISHAFSRARTGEDTAESLDFLMRDYIRSIPSSLKQRKLLAKAEELGFNLVRCSDCGSIEVIDSGIEEHSVVRHGDSVNRLVCDDCISDHYYWSEAMEQYLHEGNAYRFYDTSTGYNNGRYDWVTSGWAHHADLYSYSGEYFTETAYYDLGFSDEEDYDDDSGYYRDDGLDDYHGADRDFVEVNATPLLHPALGVELEVYAQNRRAAVSAIRARFDYDNLIMERDGSLDESRGFEMVTQPYGKGEWITYGKELLEVAQNAGCVGYNAPSSNWYGIHVNVHRRNLSPLQEARMLMFMTAAENVWFVKAMAQRNTIYGADVDMGAYSPHNQKIRNLGGLNRSPWSTDLNGKICGIGKYTPINLDGDIAEFRIFNSTLHYPSFMKNLEFVWALIEWTNPVSATGSTWRYEDFCSWLSKRPNVEEDYAYLLAYLRKQSYRVKRGVGTIDNKWKHLVATRRKNKPVEQQQEDSVESMTLVNPTNSMDASTTAEAIA